MYEDTKVSQLVINQLSEEKFKELLENNELDPNQLYCTDDNIGYTPPLLSRLWSEHLLNDISWLRADTFSWQSGDVYVAAHKHLLDDLKGIGCNYGWLTTELKGACTTIDRFPEVGTEVYTYNSGATGTLVEAGLTVVSYDKTTDELVLSDGTICTCKSYSIPAERRQTETIGDITITFYRAEDKHKICLPDQEDKILALYNATGVAWYYILDTMNKQFKLPRSKHNKYADIVPVVGNGMALGITNGQTSRAIGAATVHDSQTTTALMLSKNEPKNMAVGTSVSVTNAGGNDLGTGKAYGVSTTPDSSGLIAQQVQDTDQYKYLYFYVGCFDKEGLEQTAGLNAELFNQKMDNGTPLIRDIFSPDEWENNSMEQILSAGVGSGDLVFIKNWQEFDYLWFSSVSDGSNTLDDSPHWLNVKWMLSQAKAGVTNLAVARYASGAYWYVNPQTWTETTMSTGSGSESLFINRVYGIKLKNITAKNVGLLNYKGLFETASDLVSTTPTDMGQWAIVASDETQGGLQTKYFSTKDVSGNFAWAFGGIIDLSLVGCDYVVESQLPTAENGYTWYRKYKSGWVEQGGKASGGTGTGAKIITLPIEFSDNNYVVVLTSSAGSADNSYNNSCWVSTRNTTSFTYYNGNNSMSYNPYWLAIGY